MKPVMPAGLELPDNVKLIQFTAPEGMEDAVQNIHGLVHLDEEGQPLGFEFMFELDKKEIQVLRHEPYITISFMGQGITPFKLETTIPHDDMYRGLMEHTHVCTSELTHENNKWWSCDNPTHNTKENRVRNCADCVQEAGVQGLLEL